MNATTTFAAICAATALTSLTLAQPQPSNGEGVTPEPVGNVSFVRTYDNKIAFEDHRLASLITANVGAGKRWASVDIVMQQCFGGGFVNDVIGRTAAPVTITTASDWNETAWSIQEAPGTSRALRNFTQSWVDAARANANAPMRQLAFSAAAGDWAAPNNPNYRATIPENFRYASRDAAPGGANDLRRIGDGPTTERLFTGMGIFGKESSIQPRHYVNVARVAGLIAPRTQSSRIATLAEGNFPSLQFVNTYRPDPNVLPDLAINGRNTAANVDRIFDGSIYAATAQAGDRLLFYATGHGGRAQFGQFGNIISDTDGDDLPDRQRIRVAEFRPEQREAGGVPSETFNPNMFGDRDEDTGIDQIQLHFTQALPQTMEILINNVNVTDELFAVALDNIRSLPAQNETSGAIFTPFVLQVDLLRSLLTADPSPGITIELVDTAGTGMLQNQNLLLAAGIWSGDSEFVAVNVIPAPGVMGMGIGLLAVGFRRRR